jgi:CRISPR-associated protein Cmr2
LFKQKLGEEEEEEAIKQFEEKAKNYASKDGNRGGRLVFYPSFLDLIGLDIIAPHDRETRTVKVPIQFEVSPENAKGTFSLLYFPFDLIESLHSNEKERAIEEIKENWEILIKAIQAMLTKYGFGAKTTVGYGIANIEKIEINGQNCGSDWNKALEVIKSEIGK